jgi:hypothetical protein
MLSGGWRSVVMPGLKGVAEAGVWAEDSILTSRSVIPGLVPGTYEHLRAWVRTTARIDR